MDPILIEFKQSIDKVISQLKEDLKIIRTGKANSALLENLNVVTYGGQSKLRLMELSTITIEGVSTLSITPFDSATIVDIEKAILKSPLGLSPQTQGSKIIVRLPALNEEQRQKLTKLVNQKVEERKVQTRNIRDEARKKIKLNFESKEISEDEKFRLEKGLDEQIQKSNQEIEIIKENKEKEIMEL